jgi:hypothetical protein
MQKANFSQGKPKMDKTVRRRELPCIRRSGHYIKGESFMVWCQCQWKEKSNEETKENQTK